MARISFLCEGNDDGPTGPRVEYAFTYCLFASSLFVGSLYACVPSRIRRLDRNDPRQIQWRAAASCTACLVVYVLYPYFVCEPLFFHLSGSKSLPELMKYEASACCTVILHTTLLYVGPIIRNAALVYAHLPHGRTGKPSIAQQLRDFLSLYLKIFLEPTLSTFRNGGPEAWRVWRNLILAPISEEIVFRGCIVSALSASAAASIQSDSYSMSKSRVVALAPLFFGVAHFHHAILSVRSGQRPVIAGLQTMFQFTYTSLFGSYASYVFLQTRSLSAVVLCHSYCNAMGLPDLSFIWQESSPLHTARWWITGAHIIGLLSFISTIKMLYRYSD